MKELNFNNMTSYTAIAAGIFALAYAYFFVVAKDQTMYSLALLLLGLATLEVIVGIYGRLERINPDLARVATVLGVIGATGMTAHAGYDLANAINPPLGLNLELPSQVDPRGLLTFGFLGVAIIKISFLLEKSRNFPKGLAYLGFLSGALLVIIYLARLTVLDPTNPILLYPVLINGFILSPLWYIWLGYSLLRKS